MWCDCYVRQAGPAADNDEVSIWLREVSGKFDWWFLAVKDKHYQSQMLTTALAAITSGYPVAVGFADGECTSGIPKQYARIWDLYLKKPET